MKILVACEESQRVAAAFRARGHEAYSNDILPTSGTCPEWHICQNVLDLLSGHTAFNTCDGAKHTINGTWDMIIAFPPCTYVSNAGARHLYKNGKLNIARYYQGMCAKALFEAIRRADCERIAIENPTPSRIFEYPPYTQILQPYEFGEPRTKRTLLWLKNLPNLIPTKIVNPTETCGKGGKWITHGGKDRQRLRSQTPVGLAEAMAEQWGALVE